MRWDDPPLPRCGVAFCTEAATGIWTWAASGYSYPICDEHWRQKRRSVRGAVGNYRPLTDADIEAIAGRRRHRLVDFLARRT